MNSYPIIPILDTTEMGRCFQQSAIASLSYSLGILVIPPPADNDDDDTFVFAFCSMKNAYEIPPANDAVRKEATGRFEMTV